MNIINLLDEWDRLKKNNPICYYVWAANRDTDRPLAEIVLEALIAVTAERDQLHADFMHYVQSHGPQFNARDAQAGGGE